MFVALQPCADAESQRNLEKTIYKTFNPRDLPYLPETTIKELESQLGDKQTMSVWGVKSDAAYKHWSKLTTGDVVLFYADKAFFLQSQLIGKYESEALAEHLWGRDKEGRVFKYLYFLKGSSDIDVDVFSFNEAVGYSRKNYVQGFTVMDEAKSMSALSNLSSLQSLSSLYASVDLIEQIKRAFRYFGGEASLTDVYAYIKEHFGFPIGYKDYQSVIRKSIYLHSSDADIFNRKKDLFELVGDKGDGLWRLRDFIPSEENLELTEDDESFPEGKIKLRQHLARERNSKLIRRAKQLFKKKEGRLFCQACGFDFEKVYGELGEDYIEGHHIKPVSELKEGESSQIEDIVMLCSNCHRMVHRKRPWLDMEALSSLLSINNLKQI